MLLNLIKGFIKPKYFDESYQYFDESHHSCLDRARIRAELNYLDKRWSCIEPRRFE